ncbi:SpoIIIAH-like family protein [Paenibacillus cymbidii]|uniref:SpoIIIAH-like family protein n=1 Tax=Paenibacillus cymbidii TaxID=1639034 RepID=UPI00108126EC|nr:SpoIIIAH-like family protein [Paenibacillus cymbidii]
MNTKRQTIWLVSMLSLMVVLSAYYLFTEDSGKLKVADDGTGTEEIKVDSQEIAPPATGSTAKDAGKVDNGKAVTQGTGQDTKATDAKPTASPSAKPGVASPSPTKSPAASPKPSSAATTDTKSATDSKASSGTDAKATSAQAGDSKKTDAEVLKQLSAQGQSGADYFTAMLLQRNEDFSKETERLMGIITDMKQTTDAATKANDDLFMIQQREEQINSVEEKLAKDYHNAVVLQDSGKWKIVVQNDKLDKSQAVAIVDMAAKEMNVGADKFTVQLMRP